MKKILNTMAGLAICVLFFLSCNNKGEKKETPDTAKLVTTDPITIDTVDQRCITNGNFLVSQAWVEDKRKQFEKIYRGEAPAGLTNSFWIDSCVIANFHNFLQNNDGYDGVRFYSYAENDFTDIVMIPTKQDGDHHISQWGNKVTMSASCKKPKFKNFNKTEKEMKKSREAFGDDYRNEKAPLKSEVRDSLSSGVWFSSCVLKSLMKYLGDTNLKLDGIRIYCIAYDKKYDGTGQDYFRQSSFVLVVTEAGGPGGHTDRWDVLNKKYKDDKKFRDGGYNHGQLCPTICD